MKPNFVRWQRQCKMALIFCQIDGGSSLESVLLPNNTVPRELPCQALPDANGIDWLSDEDLDNLAVRRDLAAASVAALGDFWDNEVDLEWQNFQP